MKKCQIRNNPGMSSYFGGGYRGYGRYQWNIKYYGWESEYEIEAAVEYFFGDLGEGYSGYDNISEHVLGRKVNWTIEGRSGGWLVIHDELTDAELALVDAHVTSCMKDLPEFLKCERALNSINPEVEGE